MADNQVDNRLRYFTGQFLQEPDFTDEQNYHRDRMQRHNRTLHTSGIADGLNVARASKGSGDVTVEQGTAIDASGQAIYLDHSEKILLDAAENRNTTVLVLISYAQEERKVKVQDLEPLQPNRMVEQPRIEVKPEQSAPPKETHIRLTRLHLDAEGKIDGPNADPKPQDDSVRVYAGSKLPSEVALNKLSLSRPGDLQGWPALTSPVRERLDLKGSLTLSGKVNERDVAADGKKLDEHVAATGNPHATTATDIDSQGGANQIVARINNGTGTINESRIDQKIARDSEVAANFNVTSGHSHDGTNSRKINHSSLTLDGGTNPHGTTATDIDNQGGANQIVTRINAGSGVIGETRIDQALARDNKVAAYFNTASGHDHDGANSRKIVPTSLAGVTGNVTAANLNTLTSGSASNASSLHYHQTIPTQSRRYHVPLLPLRNMDSPEFLTTPASMTAGANTRAVGKLPLSFPSDARLTRLRAHITTTLTTFKVTMNLWQLNYGANSGGIPVTLELTSPGDKEVACNYTVNNAHGAYILVVDITTPGNGAITIDGISIDYELSTLF